MERDLQKEIEALKVKVAELERQMGLASSLTKQGGSTTFIGKKVYAEKLYRRASGGGWQEVTT